MSKDNELLRRGLHFDHHVYTARLSCRHKVITEVAQSRWWINIARVESTDGRERRESGGWRREESDDGQAGVNETSSSSNSCFVNFRGTGSRRKLSTLYIRANFLRRLINLAYNRDQFLRRGTATHKSRADAGILTPIVQ